jgi:nucleoside-diphosphate-sugar epimerase
MFDKNKPVIALTGATGFLGSHIMASLLERGYRVIILGRPTKEETLRQRISKLMRWFGIEEPIGQPETVEIDLLKPLMGIPEVPYNELCARTDQIIHCASDTNFSERKRNLVFKANVDSLTGILEFAAKGHAKKIHYISTAYVAGAENTLCKETLPGASGFVNVYEESKAQAENIMAAYCEKNSIPLTIIRPSIVYGDSRTGRSLKFSALYFPIKSVQHIRDIYLNDIKNHGGKRSRENGIFLDSEGYLHLPLRIRLPQKGSINLVPVDYFVQATLKIIENASSGGIYHLTHNSPPTFETLAAYNAQFTKIRGVEIIYGNADKNIMRNPAEELFDHFIEPYRPYFSDTRVFERTNTDTITGGLHPPEFTNEIFKRCMDFAVQAQWGKDLYSI